MKPASYEVMILNPTAIFYELMIHLLPADQKPDIQIFNVDNTAYLLRRQVNDHALLAFIQKRFKMIFQYEMSRWIHFNEQVDFESKYIDFLCCFNIEMHNQIILFEKSMDESQCLLKIKHKEPMMSWIKNRAKNNDELKDICKKITLSHLNENASIILKNFYDIHYIKHFLKKRYYDIYEIEMLRMCNSKKDWPKIDSFDEFCLYFGFSVHTHVIHLN